MKPWWAPKAWLRYTEREGSHDWKLYAICRLIGHRPKTERDGFAWCGRCGDTLPEGARRWQK